MDDEPKKGDEAEEVKMDEFLRLKHDDMIYQMECL
jgi:hypothetical protein